MPVLNGLSETGKPDEPDSELAIHMIVPEEFAGMSMGELNSRRGRVTGIEVQSGRVVIRASLPLTEYDGLEKAIDAGTEHRGRIERAPRQ